MEKRISSQSIKVLGNISTQKNLEKKDLNNYWKTLWYKFFKDVNLSLDKGNLIINVIENPIIENIEITGIKNKTFIKEISEITVLKNRMSFSEIELQKDINTSTMFLKQMVFIFQKLNHQ